MAGFSDVEIIYGTEGLMRAQGFWSKKEILVSTKQAPAIHLIKEKATTADLIQVIDSYIDKHLYNWVVEEYRLCIKQFNKVPKLKRKKMFHSMTPVFSFYEIPAFMHPGLTWAGKPTMYQILEMLRAEGRSDKEIANVMADAWIGQWRENTPRGLNLLKGHRTERRMAKILQIPWNKMGSLSTGEFLKTLLHLSEMNMGAKRFLGLSSSTATLYLRRHWETIRAGLTTAEEELIATVKLGFLLDKHNQSHARALLSLPAAATRALVVLCDKEFTLLAPVKGWLSHVLPNAYSEMELFDSFHVEGKYRSGYALMLGATTIRNPQDIPIDLPDLLPLAKNIILYKPLHRFLQSYSKERGLAAIDLCRFERGSRRMVDLKIGSVEWFRANRFGEAWEEFAMLALELADAGDSTTRSRLRRLADWACPRFASPWDVRPIDLRNPAKPNSPDTFFAFLKKSQNASNVYHWSQVAKTYRVVGNYLNTPGYPGYKEEVTRLNPFKTIGNPFKASSRSGNKTPRSRISTVIHEKLIEVLLSPDENKRPIFTWAKEASKKYFYASDFNADGTWCPSRWTSLALLLLLPLRKKQVRWLDQGLMDELIFDPATFTMVENSHRLRDFRYEDGQTQKQKHGRPTGAVQPITDNFMGATKHLGLFINTNKTQIWNRSCRNGYELPWPDGSELIGSQDKELQEHGYWLYRVYELLSYQYQYVQKQDPDPTPLTFQDIAQDARQIPKDEEARSALPFFVPLFRDVPHKITLKHSGKTSYGAPPISSRKIDTAFKVLCMEVEAQFNAEGFKQVTLTIPNTEKNVPTKGLVARTLKYDIHCLRVAGISRLIEMGIDPTVVQEFLAGHLSPAMTHHYSKVCPWHVREKIIEGVVCGNTKGSIEPYYKETDMGKLRKENVLVSAPRFRDHINDLQDDYSSFSVVAGGICTAGGMGDSCNEGGAYEREVENKDDTEIIFGPVRGGCGNCRFFKTAAFLIQEQAFYLDVLMDNLRTMSHQRTDLRTKITEFDCSLADCINAPKRHLLEDERSVHKARLEQLNHDMVPMITEWVNRYLMLQDCQEHLDEIEDGERPELTLTSTFGSPAGLTAGDLKIEVEETTNIGLAARIVERARILEGRGIPVPEKPAMMIQKSVDKLLRMTDSPALLLDIGANQINRAASMLYNALEESLGAETIEQAVNGESPLALEKHKKEQINQFAEAVVTAAQRRQLFLEGVLDVAKNSNLVSGPRKEILHESVGEGQHCPRVL